MLSCLGVCFSFQVHDVLGSIPEWVLDYCSNACPFFFMFVKHELSHLSQFSLRPELEFLLHHFLPSLIPDEPSTFALPDKSLLTMWKGNLTQTEMFRCRSTAETLPEQKALQCWASPHLLPPIYKLLYLFLSATLLRGLVVVQRTGGAECLSDA